MGIYFLGVRLSFVRLAMLICLLALADATLAAHQERTIALQFRVTEGRDGPGIPGAKVWLSNGFWTRAVEGEAVGYADQHGVVKLTVPLEESADTKIYASAIGYEDSRLPRLTIRMTRHYDASRDGFDTIKIPLERIPGVIATVTVLNRISGEKIGGASVTFMGKGTFAPVYEGTTAGNGTAPVSIETGGDYTLEVRAEGFQPFSKEIRISLNSGAAVNETALLTSRFEGASATDRLESRILATVLGNGKRLAGATVQQGGNAFSTNANGTVVVVGQSAAGDDVTITASASGYKSGSKIVTLQPQSTSTARKSEGAVTFDLVPGEDEVDPSMPIQLKLIFLDKFKDNMPVAGISAALRFQNGKAIDGIGYSDASEGAVHFRIEEMEAAPLDMIRKGVTVEIYPGKDYQKPAPYSITADSLKPSRDERAITIFLTPKVLPFQADVDQFVALYAVLEIQVREVEALGSHFDTMTKSGETEIQNLRKEAEKVWQLVSMGLREQSPVGFARDACTGRTIPGIGKSVADMQQDIETGLRNAEDAARNITEILMVAKRLVEQCEASDAGRVKELYRNSIQKLGELGAIEKSLRETNSKLNSLNRQIADVDNELREVKSRVAELDNLANRAKFSSIRSGTEVKSFEGEVNRVRNDAREAETRRSGLKVEYDRLARLGAPGLPASAAAGLETMRLSLAKWTNVSEAEALGRAEFAAEAAAEVAGIRDKARQLLEISQTSSRCVLKTHEKEIEDVSAKVLNAEFEVRTAADFPRRADDCAQSNQACVQLTSDIRSLLERGAIETAEAKLKEARSRSCQLGDLDQQLDTYRYVRDAAVAIMSLSDQCRFQDAETFANKIPESLRSLSLIQDAMARNRIGAKAQATVRDLMDRANAASQRGDRAGAAALLRDAQREASLDGRWYACVSPMLNLSSAPPGSGAPTAVPSSGAPATGSSPPSGPLIAKVEVKPSRQEGPAGRDKYSYSATSANIDSVSSEGQVHVSVTYTGVPQSLTPGADVIITVSGSLSAQPQAYGANWLVTAWVEAVGLEAGSGQSASYSTKGVRAGKYVFRVPLNATSATITLKGDFGIGEPAVYRYQRKQ